MIKYTCKSCNITTELSECPHCGERTEIVNSTIYWCKFCNIPTFDEHCPICGSKGKRIGSDIRPVFPQERLLLEILLDCPLKYKNSSVWNTAGNYYYADGEKLPFTASQTNNARVMTMFMAIRNFELKNVRTLQYDSKDMVKRITNYIVKQADNAASDSKEADVE